MVSKAKTSLVLLLTLLTMILVMFLSLDYAVGEPIIWSEERQLTFDPVDDEANTTIVDDDRMASITATRDNKIWVAWRSDVIMGNYEIFYKKYDHITGNWTNDIRFTFNPTKVDTNPAILQTSDNKTWFFWACDKTGNYELFYKTTSNNGASWSTETQLTDYSGSDVSPALTQTNDGKIWLAWTRTTSNEDIFYKTYDGTSWSAEAQLTTNTDNDHLSTVTQAKDGKIWVFWSRFMSGEEHDHIWGKWFDGSTWSSETQLTTDAKDNMEPSAFVQKNGTIWLFWQSKEQKPKATWDLYYKISSNNGTTWSSPVQFTTDRANDMSPSTTQAPDASIWVVWASTRDDPYRNPNIDLYYKTSFVHNVAVTDIDAYPTPIFQTQIVSINVTAKNVGDYSESFTVYCYVNLTLLGSESVTLGAKASTNLTFSWDTSTFSNGNYTIKAEVSSVLGESYIGDNNHSNGPVKVKLLGDTNDDVKVNVLDLFDVGKAYNSDPSKLNWNENCDFNGDKKVNASDLWDFASNYGREG